MTVPRRFFESFEPHDSARDGQSRRLLARRIDGLVPLMGRVIDSGSTRSRGLIGPRVA